MMFFAPLRVGAADPFSDTIPVQTKNNNENEELDHVSDKLASVQQARQASHITTILYELPAPD